jgi:hypothetical protein
MIVELSAVEKALTELSLNFTQIQFNDLEDSFRVPGNTTKKAKAINSAQIFQKIHLAKPTEKAIPAIKLPSNWSADLSGFSIVIKMCIAILKKFGYTFFNSKSDDMIQPGELNIITVPDFEQLLKSTLRFLSEAKPEIYWRTSDRTGWEFSNILTQCIIGEALHEVKEGTKSISKYGMYQKLFHLPKKVNMGKAIKIWKLDSKSATLCRVLLIEIKNFLEQTAESILFSLRKKGDFCSFMRKGQKKFKDINVLYSTLKISNRDARAHVKHSHPTEREIILLQIGNALSQKAFETFYTDYKDPDKYFKHWTLTWNKIWVHEFPYKPVVKKKDWRIKLFQPLMPNLRNWNTKEDRDAQRNSWRKKFSEYNYSNITRNNRDPLDYFESLSPYILFRRDFSELLFKRPADIADLTEVNTNVKKVLFFFTEITDVLKELYPELPDLVNKHKAFLLTECKKIFGNGFDPGSSDWNAMDTENYVTSSVLWGKETHLF